MTKARLVAASATLAFALSLSSSAAAQVGSAKEERARAAFEEGKRQRDAGNWEAACTSFAAADATFSTGGTMFAVADCEERRGHFKEARDLYARVVADPGSQGNAERLDRSRQRIAELDAKLRPRPAPDRLPPTPTRPTPAPATTKPKLVMNPVPGAVLLGIGGVGIIVGAVLGGLALSEIGAVHDKCTDNVCPPKERGERDAAQAKAIGADVSFAVGGAAAVVGVVLLLVLKTEPSPRVAPTASGLVVRF